MISKIMLTFQNKSHTAHTSTGKYSHQQCVSRARHLIEDSSISSLEWVLECIAPRHFLWPASSRIDHAARHLVDGLIRIAECLPELSSLRLGEVVFWLWPSRPPDLDFCDFFCWLRLRLPCIVCHGVDAVIAETRGFTSSRLVIREF